MATATGRATANGDIMTKINNAHTDGPTRYIDGEFVVECWCGETFTGQEPGIPQSLQLEHADTYGRTPTEADITAAIARAKDEILGDIADGIVPASVASFSELHDYTDANEYAGFCTSDGDVDWISGDDDGGNRVQNAVDAWIKTGAARAHTFADVDGWAVSAMRGDDVTLSIAIPGENTHMSATLTLDVWRALVASVGA